MTQYSYASPFTGQQFFDDAGKPLANGLLYAYVSNGYSKLAVFLGSDGTTKAANPIQLDGNGRLSNSEYAMLQGSNYNFVLMSVDGIVVQTYNNVTTQKLNGSEYITITRDDPTVSNTMITSTSIQPGQAYGDSYMFWAMIYSLPFTGEITLPGGVMLKTPTTVTNPDVSYDSSTGFTVNRPGAYQIEIQSTFQTDSESGWPTNEVVFGTYVTTQYGCVVIGQSESVTWQGDNLINPPSISITDVYNYSFDAGSDLTFYNYIFSPDYSDLVGNCQTTYTVTHMGDSFDVSNITPNVPNSDFFMTSDDYGVQPVVMFFSDTTFDSTGMRPTKWLWDFGDGTTSTEQSPDHNFNQNSVYNITLTASNDTWIGVSNQQLDLT